MKHIKITLSMLIVLLTTAFGTAYAQDADDPIRIGYFLWFSPGDFKDEMTQLGYVEGKDVTYLEISFPTDQNLTMEESFAIIQQQVDAIIATKPDAIVTNTDSDAAMMRLTAGDIPIVFARSDDPVATGAVADLINPGGQTTGVITNRPHERRLQVLTEVKPTTKKVYYLYSTLSLEGEQVLEQVQKVADDLDVEVIPAPFVDVHTALEVLENAPEDIDWLFLTPYVPFEPEFAEKLNEVSLSLKAGIAGVLDTPTQGYLVGYGPNVEDSDRQAARMIDRILRGASPADLPVQTAENYLTINLETAETLGLEVPVGILRQANFIVRPGYFENLGAPGN